jgi:drug/metabolite transporter (DMT)-like permease
VSFFLIGERLRRPGILGLVLSAVGIALIVLRGGSAEAGDSPLLGGLLMLGSAICWAFYTVLCRCLAGYEPMRLTAAGALYGTAMLVPLAAIEATRVGLGPTTPLTWATVVYLAVGPSALAYLLWTYGLQAISANQAGAFLNLIPVAGLILAALVLGEQPGLPALVGGGLVLLGVSLTTRSRGVARRPTAALSWAPADQPCETK